MATRAERRKAEALNKPAKISYKLIEELVEQGNEAAAVLQLMLNEEIYATRIKIKAYGLGFIGERDFLNMTDPYDLPLGLDGENFRLANYVVEEMTRFNLSSTLAEKGDLLTAYMVDRYDSLYETITAAAEDFITDTAYQEEFVAMLLDNNADFAFSMVVEFLDSNKRVKKLIK